MSITSLALHPFGWHNSWKPKLTRSKPSSYKFLVDLHSLIWPTQRAWWLLIDANFISHFIKFNFVNAFLIKSVIESKSIICILEQPKISVSVDDPKVII